MAFTTLPSSSSLTASAVTQNSATLTIGSHTGNWYVKKTAPAPAGNCSSAVGGATHQLSSLTPGTPHVYQAYSASGCADATLAARGSFTTGGVSVGNLDEKQGTACSVSNTARCAQGFTTGKSAGGYTLHSVATVFYIGKAAPAFTLALHKASGGKPAASAVANAAFSFGSSISRGSLAYDYIHTCAGSGCDLAADTDYFIVITTADGFSYLWLQAESSNETKIPSDKGWSLADKGLLGNDWGT